MQVRYCLCGASVRIRSAPRDLADHLADQFDQRHSGEGHGQATRQQAANARRREERRALKADFAEVTQ